MNKSNCLIIGEGNCKNDIFCPDYKDDLYESALNTVSTLIANSIFNYVVLNESDFTKTFINVLNVIKLSVRISVTFIADNGCDIEYLKNKYDFDNIITCDIRNNSELCEYIKNNISHIILSKKSTCDILDRTVLSDANIRVSRI